MARAQVVAISTIPSPKASEEDEVETIKRAARDFSSWSNAYRLEKEDGVYINGAKLDVGQTYKKSERPPQADGHSWAWCLWEAVVHVPADIETFSLVARVGKSPIKRHV